MSLARARSACWMSRSRKAGAELPGVLLASSFIWVRAESARFAGDNNRNLNGAPERFRRVKPSASFLASKQAEDEAGCHDSLSKKSLVAARSRRLADSASASGAQTELLTTVGHSWFWTLHAMARGRLPRPATRAGAHGGGSP